MAQLGAARATEQLQATRAQLQEVQVAREAATEALQADKAIAQQRRLVL